MFPFHIWHHHLLNLFCNTQLLHVQLQNHPEWFAMKMYPIHKNKCGCVRNGESANKRRQYAQQQSVIFFENLSATEVSSKTGCHDIDDLLSFDSIICGGHRQKMTKTISYWLEEWFFYCDMMYGHCCLAEQIMCILIKFQ